MPRTGILLTQGNCRAATSVKARVETAFCTLPHTCLYPNRVVDTTEAVRFWSLSSGAVPRDSVLKATGAGLAGLPVIPRPGGKGLASHESPVWMRDDGGRIGCHEPAGSLRAMRRLPSP